MQLPTPALLLARERGAISAWMTYPTRRYQVLGELIDRTEYVLNERRGALREGAMIHNAPYRSLDSLKWLQRLFRQTETFRKQSHRQNHRSGCSSEAATAQT
jgi:hypothetical protein